MPIKLVSSALETLRSNIEGTVFTPEEHGYVEACQAWDLTVEQQPALVVTIANAKDAMAAVNFARRQGLKISIQSTGHGIISPSKGGLLINTSGMKGIKIDSQTQTALVEAGVRWNDVIQAAQTHNLATLSGYASNVGVVGYTLGGGIGWLVRKYGPACDSIRNIHLVTADGQMLQVSKNSNSKLFWALRGGGSSFGIVTSIEFDLYPVVDIYGGQLFYPAEMARKVLNLYSDWVEKVPDELTSAIALMQIPPEVPVANELRGKPAVVLSVCYLGDEKQGAELLRPFRELEPLLDRLESMQFKDIGKIHNDPHEPQHTYGHCGLLKSLSPDVIDRLVDLAGAGSDSPLQMVELRHLQGAMAHNSGHESALIDRDAAFLLQVQSVLTTPEQTTEVKQYTASLAEMMRPYETGGVFPNFRHRYGSNDPRRRAVSSQDSHNRLLNLKEKYDPQNLF